MKSIMSIGKKQGKNFWNNRAIFIPIAIAVGVLFLGSVVMFLWNTILTDVLGIRTITIWQAMGILILSKILFGGFHGGHHRHGFYMHRKDVREKWMQLSPEEQEKMRNQWWGKFEPPTNQE